MCSFLDINVCGCCSKSNILFYTDIFKPSLRYCGCYTSSCPFWPSFFFFFQQLYKSCPSTSSGKSFSVTAGGPTNRLMSALFVILWFQSAGPGQVKMNSFFFFFTLVLPKIHFFGPHKSAQYWRKCRPLCLAVCFVHGLRRVLSRWALSFCVKFCWQRPVKRCFILAIQEFDDVQKNSS